MYAKEQSKMQKWCHSMQGDIQKGFTSMFWLSSQAKQHRIEKHNFISIWVIIWVPRYHNAFFILIVHISLIMLSQLHKPVQIVFHVLKRCDTGKPHFPSQKIILPYMTISLLELLVLFTLKFGSLLLNWYYHLLL